MDVREAVPEDGAAIRDVAQRSLEASYSLSPTTIENAVERWYDDEALAEKFDDDELQFVVAEDDGEVVGFAEVALVEGAKDADLLWLHVAPENRGQGAGDALFEAARDVVEERGIERLRGRVLADNAEGNDFYRRHGFEKAGEVEVEIDGKAHVENVYIEEPVELETVSGPDGATLYIDRSDPDRGTKGGFVGVYRDQRRERRYGYFCTNCETLVTTMDSMGRIECGSCGNVSKPTRWDAAYM